MDLPLTNEEERMQRITALLLKHSNDRERAFWPWLYRRKETSKKDANKFMLAGIIDYKIRAKIT